MDARAVNPRNPRHRALWNQNARGSIADKRVPSIARPWDLFQAFGDQDPGMKTWRKVERKMSQFCV
jgi:hypothetical protein